MVALVRGPAPKEGIETNEVVMRSLFAALCLSLTVPAQAGIDVENLYVSLHKTNSSPIDARFRVHCQEVTPGACPGGMGGYDSESPTLTRLQWMDVRAAAAASTCTTGAVPGSPFDATVSAYLGTWWTTKTAATKAQFCVIVDEWW